MRTVKCEDVKEKYPHPKAAGASGSASETYCVGGALCLYMRRGWWRRLRYKNWSAPNWPGIDQLSIVLKDANQGLPSSYAQKYANSIIFNNDSRNIDRAWQKLCEALEYGR